MDRDIKVFKAVEAIAACKESSTKIINKSSFPGLFELFHFIKFGTGHSVYDSFWKQHLSGSASVRSFGVIQKCEKL